MESARYPAASYPHRPLNAGGSLPAMTDKSPKQRMQPQTLGLEIEELHAGLAADGAGFNAGEAAWEMPRLAELLGWPHAGLGNGDEPLKCIDGFRFAHFFQSSRQPALRARDRHNCVGHCPVAVGGAALQ